MKIGPFNNPEQAVSYISFVTNTGSDWDNNGGKDYRLNIKANSGVGSVAADEAAPEYYTLQGVRVENPSAGIYICRRGSKVSKVIFR